VRSVDDLLSAAIDTADDDARWSAIQELHALGSREVFDRARLLCQAPQPVQRAAGAEIIGQLNEFADDARAIVTRMLDDEDASVVEAAVHALGQQQNARTLDALARAATHAAANVRWAVATALEDLISDERAQRVLLALMRDDDTDVRDRATFAVGCLSDHDSPRIRSALFERLQDADPAVANEAALGLARRRDARAIAYIARAVEQFEAADIGEAVEEITSPEMLPELLRARDAGSSGRGMAELIERCRARL
jgi:HEAT repeat protein